MLDEAIIINQQSRYRQALIVYTGTLSLGYNTLAHL